MAFQRMRFSFWTQLDTEKNVELSKIWQQEISWEQIIPERFSWIKIAIIFSNAVACTG